MLQEDVILSKFIEKNSGQLRFLQFELERLDKINELSEEEISYRDLILAKLQETKILNAVVGKHLEDLNSISNTKDLDIDQCSGDVCFFANKYGSDA